MAGKKTFFQQMKVSHQNFFYIQCTVTFIRYDLQNFNFGVVIFRIPSILPKRFFPVLKRNQVFRAMNHLVSRVIHRSISPLFYSYNYLRCCHIPPEFSRATKYFDILRMRLNMVSIFYSTCSTFLFLYFRPGVGF